MVAIYVRQSVEKKDSISIESQIEHCRGKLLPGEEYTIYEDKGFSGKNTDRPQFLAMMQDVKNGRITKVIIYKLDRISRAILDFANMMDIFDRQNVHIVSCSDPIDTTTPMGRAMITVTMTFAQLERETIQQRIKDNYYARGRQGYYLGGRAPFGYRKVETVLHGKKTYTFVPDDSRGDQAAALFLEYGTTDISLGKLAAWLTEAKITTNSAKAWSGVSLGRLLRNPVYVKADAFVYVYLKSKGATMNNDVSEYTGENGCYVYAPRKGITTSKFSDLSNSYVTLALHKGLIPSDLWLRCQRKLDKNQQVKNSGKGTHSWLSGLMKCGYCSMAVNVVSNRGSGYISCGGRKLKVCYGRKRVVKLEQIEAAVLAQLFYRIGAISAPEELPPLEDSRQINRLKMELVRLDEKINNYMRRIEQANTVVMEYINRNMIMLDRKKRELEARMNRLPAKSRPEEKGPDICACVDHWESFSFQEKKNIAKLFIETVYITDDQIQIFFY